MSERLHPQSWRELRQLVNLHGADAIIRAVKDLKKSDEMRDGAKPDPDKESQP